MASGQICAQALEEEFFPVLKWQHFDLFSTGNKASQEVRSLALKRLRTLEGLTAKLGKEERRSDAGLWLQLWDQ